jgi:hypothetical protein
MEAKRMVDEIQLAVKHRGYAVVVGPFERARVVVAAAQDGADVRLWNAHEYLGKVEAKLWTVRRA